MCVVSHDLTLGSDCLEEEGVSHVHAILCALLFYLPKVLDLALRIEIKLLEQLRWNGHTASGSDLPKRIILRVVRVQVHLVLSIHVVFGGPILILPVDGSHISLLWLGSDLALKAGVCESNGEKI